MDEKDFEIIALREELDNLKSKIKENQKSRIKYSLSISNKILKSYFGRNLYKSTENIISGNIDNESIANILINILFRFTRIGFFAILIGVLPTLILVIQTFLLRSQNEKIEIQNKIIETQTSLIESSRMTSYVNMVESIIRDMETEIAKNGSKILSPSIINRISSLTKSVRPYRYLEENNEISKKLTSPERTQLLNYIINLNLEDEIQKKIFKVSDFSYSNLSYARYSNLNLEGITCINCDFSGSVLKNINLKNSTLYDIDLINCKIDSCDFFNAELIAAEIEWTEISNTNLSNTNLQGIYFENSSINNSDLDSAWVSDDKFIREKIRIDGKYKLITEYYHLSERMNYGNNEKSYDLVKK